MSDKKESKEVKTSKRASSSTASGSSSSRSDQDVWIERYRTRALIRQLEKVKGQGTSMVTVIARGGESVSSIVGMLKEEAGTASNIKDRVNRLSVLAAISAASERLKTKYSSGNSIPRNGLVLYAGEILLNDGKTKLLCIDFVPYKPINTKMYRCDKLFQTAPLSELLEDEKCNGFIIIDGESVCLATLSGTNKTILWKKSTSPPSKTRRGGQSAARIDRLRKEKIDLWVTLAVEQANLTFVKNEMVIVQCIVLAGKSNTKQLFRQHDKLKPQIKKIMLSTDFDVAYGLQNGLSEAIRLSATAIVNRELDAQREILTTYFSTLSKGGGDYSVSVKDTMFALEAGAVKDLIVWDELSVSRNTYAVVTNSTGASASIVNALTMTYTKLEEKVPDKIKIKDVDYALVKSESLMDWLTEEKNRFGSKLHIVSSDTSEGTQFVDGFGGLGGMLHYRFDIPSMDEDDDNDNYCGDDANNTVELGYNDSDFI